MRATTNTSIRSIDRERKDATALLRLASPTSALTQPDQRLSSEDLAQPQRVGSSFWQALGAQDELFLLAERRNAPLHVAALLLLSNPVDQARRSHVDIARLRAYVEARLDALPDYRRRLDRTPLTGKPVWVDDAQFDVSFHVRHSALPFPGDESQLRELLSQLMSQPLGRGKPLWDLHVVEGLQQGRTALIARAHHCLVDGVGGVRMLTALLDLVPAPLPLVRSDWRAAPVPSRIELLTDELTAPLRNKVNALREMATEGQPSRIAHSIYHQAAGLVEVVSRSLQPAPSTPLNREISPHRRVAWLTLDLDEVMAVKDQLGGTLNDVVVTTVAGALRRFLIELRGIRRPRDLRALIPVNRRAVEDSTAAGNRIGALLVRLPLSVANPLDRHRAVRRAVEAAKRSRQAEATEWLMGRGGVMLNAGARLLEKRPQFNVVITNVPGPRSPLHLGESRVDAIYPQVPLFARQGLGIALCSYAERLCWGFNADPTLVPDVQAFAAAVAASFRELRCVGQELATSVAERRRTPASRMAPRASETAKVRR